METTTPSQKHCYFATNDQLLDRVRRIESQVRDIERTVEDARYCTDILTELSAIQAALDKVALGPLDGHARHCVTGDTSHETPTGPTDELDAAAARPVRRG